MDGWMQVNGVYQSWLILITRCLTFRKSSHHSRKGCLSGLGISSKPGLRLFQNFPLSYSSPPFRCGLNDVSCCGSPVHGCGPMWHLFILPDSISYPTHHFKASFFLVLVSKLTQPTAIIRPYQYLILPSFLHSTPPPSSKTAHPTLPTEPEKEKEKKRSQRLRPPSIQQMRSTRYLQHPSFFKDN